MPCEKSHTKGPGPEDAIASEEAARYDAEQAQQEADHRRDVEQDREMMTEDPERPPSQPSLGLPYIRGVEHLRVLNYSYWNANGAGICIAAVEGAIADWAAYIGADDGMRSEDCVEWTIRRGCKLSRKQANRWFPELPIEAYRE